MKLLLAALASLSLQVGFARAEVVEWTNGQWFDGQGFAPRIVWTEQGQIRDAKPTSVDRVVDLGSRFVIPPFGEAHNHDLASDHELDENVQRYLRDGVFYAKMQSAFSIATTEDRLNRPDSVDVSYAFAPITGPGGHPIRLREVFFDRGYYEGIFQDKAAIAGIGYTEITNLADLKQKWRGLMAQGPDFIKLVLSWSEEYELRRDDDEFFGRKGLDPALVPTIVRAAHAAGLRVTAHINTGADFHHAIAGGVDEIAHMPGVTQPEVIRREDAATAAEKGVVVVTTLSLTTNIADDYPAWYQRVMEQHAANLRRLHEAGVTIAIGSDFPYRDTSLQEAMLVHSTGVFSNLEMLRMWSINAPKTIFPDRRIACFDAGCEASFLVLEEDPVENFEAVRGIHMRVKQGHTLALDDSH
ncbi:MAG: amidohydrolase family protein [Xanthomonadales bacterium]|nr:amidohydrolase family protein [Xanthomonadales bacterium]